MTGKNEAFRIVAGRVKLAPLDRIGWLAEEPDALRAAIAEAGRWRRFEAGQFLYQAGDPSSGLYGLAEGALDITFPLVAEEPVTVHRAEIGFWIGDSAELSGTPRLVSVSAASPSRVLHVPGEAMRRILAARPEHWRALYRLSARNMETAVRLLSEALSLTVRARVARRLLALAGRDGAVSITQSDLAKLVGVTRATLQRCLSELEAGGVLRRGYAAVHVGDPLRLRRLADEQ
jgi:cAMP-binding proteins - catabolite gene activator and regulatory subunit of cAMP-dependent protein kinases